jgi:acyl-CoA synthetase (AMP-forming)/AMP-acid ligase II
MQNQPLLLSSLLRHAERFHAQTEIVSRTIRLTDRAKDIIKSGGEWISSIDADGQR